MIGILVAAAAIGLPLAFFVAWPLIRHRGAPVLLALPPDPREPLLERKAAALRALRELDFEHDADHVSDDDYTEPDRMAAAPMAGAPPLASVDAPATPSSGEGGRTLPPEMLRGMLQAARQSLFAGRPQEASAAYQAVLKRDPQNVDALTHLGLLLVMSADGAQRGELVDHGLRLFDRALGIDPNYPPALFYRGQVLYDLKHDASGAIASWEKFVAVAPPGEDRDRVAKQIADAKAAKPSR